jgi:hypothetical protein
MTHATAYSRSPVEVEQRGPRQCRPQFRCTAQTPRGRCRAPQRPESRGLCYWHDQEMAAYRATSSARGGRAPRRPSLLPALQRFDLDSLGNDEAWRRFQRLVFSALVQGRLKSNVARFLLDQAKAIRDSLPRPKPGMHPALRTLLDAPPRTGWDDDEDDDGPSNTAAQYRQ